MRDEKFELLLLMKLLILMSKIDKKIPLLHLMYELSEKYRCAGWFKYCEIDLWEAANCDSARGYKWGHRTITKDECSLLKVFSKDCKGWWIGGYLSKKIYKKPADGMGEVFVPLSDWKQIYKTLKPQIGLKRINWGQLPKKLKGKIVTIDKLIEKIRAYGKKIGIDIDKEEKSNVEESKPCPYCGKPLRTSDAKQCPHCLMNWLK